MHKEEQSPSIKKDKVEELKFIVPMGEKYVKRNLGNLETTLVSNPDVLSEKQLEYLAVIRKLYE